MNAITIISMVIIFILVAAFYDAAKDGKSSKKVYDEE